eukprot:2446110-Rhodomonas_salina.2
MSAPQISLSGYTHQSKTGKRTPGPTCTGKCFLGFDFAMHGTQYLFFSNDHHLRWQKQILHPEIKHKKPQSQYHLYEKYAMSCTGFRSVVAPCSRSVPDMA